MLDRTRNLWDTQRGLVGDRRPLFDAVAEFAEASEVLYPGSYVDLTPSFVWRSVTYVDTDRRANRFFADVGGVRELLAENGADPSSHDVAFLHSDYREPLDLDDESQDLLISLYAGFVSEHCTNHLRIGGHLLVNPSHGDVAMASIDPRYRLVAVLDSGTAPKVRSGDLSSYLVPRRVVDVTRELLHATGRGVAYARPAFAYVFERYA